MAGRKALERFNDDGAKIDAYLRLRTFPVGIKMLMSEKDTPPNAVRPKRDFGYHLAACQAFSTIRNRYVQDMTIALLKEDMWCPEAVIGYGLAEPPESFFEGRTRYPTVVPSVEAAQTWAAAFPRLEAGRYIGIVASRLATSSFEPDVVIIYCNSFQLRGLLMAAAWEKGEDTICRMSGAGACVYSVVPVLQSGKCHVAVPCTGDRKWAMAQDDELIFAAPGEKLGTLVEALRYLQAHGRAPARHPAVMPEYNLEESYADLAKKMGMEVS